MPDKLQTEVDERRHSTTPRNQYVNKALAVRFLLEDEGEWDGVFERAEAEYGTLLHSDSENDAEAPADD